MEFPVPHDPALRCIRLSIPAHRRHLSLLGAAVEAVAREAGLSADSAYAFNMAVVQAISAVLRYTGPDSTPARFELECLDAPERIQVCIHDQGSPWVNANGVAQPETTSMVIHHRTADWACRSAVSTSAASGARPRGCRA